MSPGPSHMIKTFVDWYNFNISDFDVPKITTEEVYVVWYCYILGNFKCLISTTRPDHMYYELTFDKNKSLVYVDAYVKIKNSIIDVGSIIEN